MISVIVPVRDESPAVASRFARFAADSDTEVVVADGGSEPATIEAFRRIGARVLTGPGRRGARLHEAAGAARGDFLFFVHADSKPPESALESVRQALSNGAAGGAFSLAYEDAGPAMRWIAAWANLRSRLLRLPFGDQGIFCRRDAYERSGGFRDLAVCDDLDFVLRLRRAGRFRVLREKTETSPRRYRSRGALAQVLVNWRVLAGFFAGVAPEKLERWYGK